jgi:hypothetical protein
MLARWSSFGVGLGLMLAPLVFGYGSAAAILHDVAMGVLVCVATLAALEWPRARFATALPAGWLLVAGRTAPESRTAASELVAGALLLLLAAVPSARRVLPRAGEREGAGAHAWHAPR